MASTADNADKPNHNPGHSLKQPLDQFLESLKNDRLVKIFIGADSEEPLFVLPKSLLCNTSEYFDKAIKNEHLGSAERGALRFPNDRPDVWEVMIFWMFKREIPDDVICKIIPDTDASRQLDSMLACRCWIAADMYLLPMLQDLLMMEILKFYCEAPCDVSVVREVFFNTSSDSPLRRIVAQELAWMVEKGRVGVGELQILDGAPGAAVSMHEARTWVLHGGCCDRIVIWKEFMVGGGPKKHWVYDELDTMY